MQPKFQVGEVVRFANSSWNAGSNLCGKLATICEVDEHYYQTVVTGCEWIAEERLEAVNGGMKSANESVFDSIATLSLDELRSLRAEVINAIEVHNQAIRKRRIQLLHEAINALDACMTDNDLADATFYFSDADLRAYSIADMSGVLAAELDAIEQ